MSESMPGDPPGPRRVAWGFWVAGMLLGFPCGIFLVMGMARLLSWPRSILMALASFATAMIARQLLMDLLTSHASNVSLFLALAGVMVMHCAWGYLIYGIGQKAEYWSPRWQRVWRWAALLAMFFLSLCAVGIALTILFPENGAT